MGGKETGFGRARIWVGWSCFIGRSEEGTGMILTDCVWVGG